MSSDRGAALYDVLRQVRPLVLNSARVVEVSLQPLGVSVGMRAVLEVLRDDGPLTTPAVAHRLDLTRQGVQKHVNDLLRLGYVETRLNPTHRRSVLVALTPAGGALMRGVTADELEHLAGMTADCTEAEVAAALKVLRSLNRDVRRRALALQNPRAASA